jgi:putative endonuclease
MNNDIPEEVNWSVYIIQASDDRLYTGITNNMARRWRQHQQKKGAKFFHGRSPVALCYQEPDHNRSSASQREHSIKQLSRHEKLRLIVREYGPKYLT